MQKLHKQKEEVLQSHIDKVPEISGLGFRTSGFGLSLVGFSFKITGFGIGAK